MILVTALYLEQPYKKEKYFAGIRLSKMVFNPTLIVGQKNKHGAQYLPHSKTLPVKACHCGLQFLVPLRLLPERLPFVKIKDVANQSEGFELVVKFD